MVNVKRVARGVGKLLIFGANVWAIFLLQRGVKAYDIAKRHIEFERRRLQTRVNWHEGRNGVIQRQPGQEDEPQDG